MPPNDAELLNLAARGDQSAFTRLYHRYETDLYRFVLYLAGEPETAEELFQDTWMRAVEHMGKTKITNFKSWLFTVAVNLYRDELRRRKLRRVFLGRMPVEQDRDPDETGPVTVPAVPARAEDLAIREGLSRAMQKLSLKQRTVFILTYVQGYKIREVSEMLNKAEGTVKCTLHRAINILRDELKEFR